MPAEASARPTAERHLAEQSAQRASFQRQLLQDREDFLGLVAHELKTPVTVIKAYAELLEAQRAEHELSGRALQTMREVVAHIVDQAELMSPLIEEIFDHFVQAASGPVRGHAGLGLGLYVACQIARAHQGDVWAESPGRGRGSTFFLRLPLDVAPPP
jgi:signal transduction histidine kinase